MFWESVKGSPDPADVEAYLKQFPDGLFAALARNRLKRLSDPGVETRGGDMEAIERALGLKRTERRRIQIALTASGFDPGGRDGLFGPRTRVAIGKWQASRGKAETGYLETEGAKTLLEVAPDLSGGVWAVAKDSACKLWNPDPQPGEEASWSGACEGAKATGEGRTVWRIAGRKSEFYEGGFRGGRQHGRGTAEWRDGSRYEGEWQAGRQHGLGVLTRNNKSYEGEWRHGRMPDRGVITWSYYGHRYEGEWKDGKQHGRGTMARANGTRYEGEYRDGNRHGRGTLTWPSGDRYEGEWRDGKIHGPGVASNKSGKKVAAGNATNGCFGRRDGYWLTSGATAEACGFK